MYHYDVTFTMRIGCDVSKEVVEDMVKLMLAKNGVSEETQRTVRVQRKIEEYEQKS